MKEISRTKMYSFDSLGDDTMGLVMRFLTLSEVFRLGCCSKHLFTAVIENHGGWEEVFYRDMMERGRFRKETGKGLLQLAKELQLLNKLPNDFYETMWINLRDAAPAELDARQGSSMDASNDGEIALLFGGWTLREGIKTDAWIFIRTERKWKYLFSISGMSAKYGHVVTFVEGENPGMYSFLITGGVTMGGYVGASNGVLRINIAKNFTDNSVQQIRRCFEFNADGSGTRRAYHTATRIFKSRPQLVLFGGFDEDGPIACLELFDIEKGSFNQVSLQTGLLPSPRFGHTTTLIRDENNEATVFICGGSRSKNNMKLYDKTDDLSDLVLLNLNRTEHSCTARWETIHADRLSVPAEVIQRCHSATLIGSQSLIIFGGGRPFHTVNTLSVISIPENLTNTWKYRELVVDSGARKPQPRQNHSVAWLGNNEVLVFGGCLAAQMQEELGDSWLIKFSPK